MAVVLFLVSTALLSTACDGGGRPEQSAGASQGPPHAEPGPEGAGADRQTAFRVRADFEAGLNQDRGWAGGINEVTKVQADAPFRLRFEVDAADGDRASRRYRLQMRRNAGAWVPLPAGNFPQPEKRYEWPLELLAGHRDDRRIWRRVKGAESSMRWRADEAEAHLHVATGDQPLLALGNGSFQWQPREFSVEMRLDGADGSSAGVVFDYRDPSHYSRVDVLASGRVRLVRVEGGRMAVLAEQATEVERGRWFELKLAFEGRAVVIEFDDEALVFSASLPTEAVSRQSGLYVPRHTEVAFASFLVEGEPRTPRSSIVANPAFEHGAPTDNILPVSDQPFTGGAGVSFAEHTPTWTAGGGHGEWEFPLVIRRFSDRAALNESGDRFEYRLVDGDGSVVAADAIASVTLEVPAGHLGGTFVETPMRLGPWQADNGDLYFLMEPSETWNRLMTVKSTDGGRTWREVDGENRPRTGDLEGFASVRAGDRIHMLHQTSDDVWYHAFNTADHPDAPDRWAVRDERLASPPEPPTQVADLAFRPDGSLVAVYGGPDDIRIRFRSPGGSWGPARVIDAEIGKALSGPSLVLGRDGVVHLAYTGSDGSAWYRRILPENELDEPFRFATNLGTDSSDVGAILPLLHLDEPDSVALIYRSRAGRLHERRVDADGVWSEPLVVSERRVVQNAVDSDQVAADAVVDGRTVRVLFVEENTGRLFHTIRRGGDWRKAEVVVDDADVQWVRGSIVQLPDSGRVYGFVYDAGSEGGSGMNRFLTLRPDRY